MGKELKSLLVSAERVAEGTLGETLDGVVSIVEGTGDIMALKGLTRMDLPSQVVAYLLGLRAAVVLQQRESASATAAEIATALHVDVQRVREALSRLKSSVVAKAGDGYQIPIIRIEAACEFADSSAARRSGSVTEGFSSTASC